MLLTLGLVVMVIFLFLRNVSATVIPSLALPFSIIGTFAVMYLLDYSLDNLSMMALILSVGFVVDDAIVMLENIVRHMEMGEKPLRGGAHRVRRKSASPSSRMTLSLAAVFIPVLFMGGILGRLFHEFAVTICVAILISGVVSVTLTPMLCSRFLRPRMSKARLVLPHHRALLRRDAARLRRHAAGGAAPPRGHDGELRRRAGGHRVHVHQDPQGLHSGPGHRPDLRDHRSRAGHLVSTRWSSTRSRSPTWWRRIPTWRRFMSTRGRHVGVHPGRPEFRPAGGASEAARRAHLGVNDIIADLRPKLAPSPGCASTCRIRRPSGSADRSPRACTSSRCSRPTSRSCTTRRPEAGRRWSRSCPAWRTSPAICRSQSPQVNVDIDRDKAARLAGERQPDRKRVLRCVRPALGLHHLRGHQRIQGAARTEAEISGRSATRCRCSTSRRRLAS